MGKDFEKSNILNQFKKLNIRLNQKSWSSRNTYRKSTQRILKFCYENYNIQKIENVQNKHIRAYVEAQDDKSLSTLKKEIAGFRFYINTLNNLNISRNCKECKFNLTNKELGIGGKKEFNQRTAPTIEEFNNIIDKIKEVNDESTRDTLLYGTYMGAYLGLRSKEIFSVKKSQLRNCVESMGENKKVYLKLDGEGCKGGRPREIGPLSQKQQQIVLEIYEKACRKKYVDDYVLRERNIPHSLQSRLSLWHNFYSRIGYDVASKERRNRPEYDNHLSAHSLRRFFAVNLYKKLRRDMSHEKAFSKVAENLGHGANRFELAKHYLGEL